VTKAFLVYERDGTSWSGIAKLVGVALDRAVADQHAAVRRGYLERSVVEGEVLEPMHVPGTEPGLADGVA
jgi:hypothetical protein